MHSDRKCKNGRHIGDTQDTPCLQLKKVVLCILFTGSISMSLCMSGVQVARAGVPGGGQAGGGGAGGTLQWAGHYHHHHQLCPVPGHGRQGHRL